MLTLTQRFAPDASLAPELTLALTAEDRTRSRHCFETPAGQIYLRLPRGTILRHNDLLRAEATAEQQEIWVRVIAKPEPVLVVTAQSPLALLRAAYHLGNRHVPLELCSDHLQLAADPVLKTMLMQLDVQVVEAMLPFQPEAGAYGQHSHTNEPKPAAPGQTTDHTHENEIGHSRQFGHSHTHDA